MDRVDCLDQTTNYVIYSLSQLDYKLNPLKLQKLLYYIEAWFLAFNDNKELFEGDQFEAWLHGPVNRRIYERFKDRGMYDPISEDDLPREGYNAEELPEEIRLHIDSVLEVYAPMSATQLEELTHEEDPWVKARKGYDGGERCDVPLDKKLMGSYYRKRVENQIEA